MKSPFKPYRFISTQELAYLQKKFALIAKNWNKLYASISLYLELSYAEEELDELILVKQTEGPLALLDIHYLSVIKKSLFFDQDPCFNLASEEIFKSLLVKLFNADSLELAKNTTCPTDWFYPGSPCLLLKFGNQDSYFNLYLNPHWVSSQLAKPQATLKPLAPFDDALAAETLECSVELAPLYLSLDKLPGLQVGNVLKSSHLLSQPLLLRYQQQLICEVELGQQQYHKSIQLRKLS